MNGNTSDTVYNKKSIIAFVLSVFLSVKFKFVKNKIDFGNKQRVHIENIIPIRFMRVA